MDLARLQEIFGLHLKYHSNIQIDSFIVRKNGGTDYGDLKQAIRETRKRWSSLKRLYIELERWKIEDARLQRAYDDFVPENLDDPSSRDPQKDMEDRELARLGLLEHRMGREELDDQIADTKREFCRFAA